MTKKTRKTILARLKDTPPWDWPADASDTLRAVLEHEGSPVSDRLVAVDFAGQLVAIDDDLASILLRIVGSATEPEELRARAALSLGPVLEEVDTEGFEDPEELPIAERTFKAVVERLRALYLDARVPTLVRRKVLEAAVRAPRDWQQGAIRAAWSSGDREWKVTAAFCMGFVKGFDQEILEALTAVRHDILYHAVYAAGIWSLKDAWPRVSAIIEAEKDDKALLLAAIEAAAEINPGQAGEVLGDLLESQDEEVAEAAREALSMVEGFEDEDEEPNDIW